MPHPLRSHVSPAHSLHTTAPPTPFIHLPRPFRSHVSPAHTVHTFPPHSVHVCPAHSVHVCPAHSVHLPRPLRSHVSPSTPFTRLPCPFRSHICPAHSVHTSPLPTPFTHFPRPLRSRLPRPLHSHICVAHSVYTSPPPTPFIHLPRPLCSNDWTKNCDAVQVVPFFEVKLGTCLICIQLMGSRDSSVGIVTRLQAGHQKDHSNPGRWNRSVFSKSSRPALGPAQPSWFFPRR